MKEIVNKFEQLKNSALEEKDRDLAAIHERKNEVSNLLHNLQQDRSHAVDQLALAEKNELNAFEQSKLEERKIYEDEVDHCNNLIAEAVNHKQEEQQQKVVRSLNLITNIVLVWNTVYIQEVIKQLHQEGYQIDENDFEFISPAPFAHINRLGKYSFNADPDLRGNGLRPLRKPKLNS